MAKNIIQMQLLTYQTNINTKKKKKINNNNKQTKTKFLLLFLIFQIVLAMKLNHGLSAMTILKTFIKKKLFKTTNLITKHRGNSLTEPSVNGLGETIGRLRK